MESLEHKIDSGEETREWGGRLEFWWSEIALAPCSHEGDGVDERLLGSLVQDVWDKFCHQRALLLSRQRHEGEALWQLQLHQWGDRLKELGEPVFLPRPSHTSSCQVLSAYKSHHDIM